MMVRRRTVLLTIGFLMGIGLASQAVAQVPTVKMKGEKARDRFELIANGLSSGGSQETLSPVPAKQRLVITDVLVSASGVACDLVVSRLAPGDSCPGGTPLTSWMCVPWGGGTIGHTFATGLVVPAGERVCVWHDLGTGVDVPANVLLRGYYTKASK